MQVAANRKLLFYISTIISAFVLVAYIGIDSKSYFFQDDFFLLPKYTTLSFDIFNPATNFGRPVTRDLYFYLIRTLLGEDSANYFAINLTIIATTTFLIYKVLSDLKIEKYTAGTAALIYFYMAPTIPHASWISNSQHTLAHLFAFLFISLVLQGSTSGRINLWKITFVYLLALFSNVSSFFALVFIWTYLLVRKVRDRKHEAPAVYLILGLLTTSTIVWSLLISHSAPSPYKLNLSTQYILENGKYYDGLFSDGVVGTKYRILFAAMAVIIAINFKRNILIALPLIAAICTSFGMVFFLGGQRTLGYMALPYALFGLLFLSNYSGPDLKPGTTLAFFTTVLSYAFVFYTLQSGTSSRNFFEESPYGSGIKEIFLSVKSVKISKDTTFCFGPPIHKRKESDSGFSAFWLFMGNGLAFQLVKFDDSYKRKYFYFTDPECRNPDVVNVDIGQDGAVLTVDAIRRSN